MSGRPRRSHTGRTPRRLAAVAVSVAALALSSCADVGDDVARVGNAALTTDEFSAVLDDVAGAQPASFLAPSGAINAAAAREILTRWVSAQILTRTVEAEGGEVTDDDRATARQQIDASGTYAGASDESLALIAEFEAAVLALGRTIELSPDDASALYDQGAEVAGVVCARAIIAEDLADVEAALAKVAKGRDFATVADDVNPPGNLGPGGAVLDETGAECIGLGPFTSGVATEVSDAVLAATVGTPTEPIDIGGAYAALLLRPFDEVADAASSIMAASAARTAGRDALQTADDVEVASRFGRWDGEQMAVIGVG